MIRSIIKRDGRVVLYDESKIASAILKAMEAAGEGDATDAANVANDVQSKLEKLPEDMPPQIEQVQDTVERALMKKGFEESAKKFILYRAQRTHIREANTSLMKTIDEITNIDARESDMKRDNANIDGNTSMGSMLQIGAAGAKNYNEAYLLTPEQAKAYREGDIHIHDFDFYSLTTTCTQIDIEKLKRCLKCCADDNSKACNKCELEYGEEECQNLCGYAATALSTLQAENEKLRDEVERQRRSADNRQHLYENAERAYMKVLAELEQAKREQSRIPEGYALVKLELLEELDNFRDLGPIDRLRDLKKSDD